MALSFTVGGARGTFAEPFAGEVACALDLAFGGEGEWEGSDPLHFGDLTPRCWAELQERAVAELGAEGLPHLLALDEAGRGVYLPAHVQAVALPMAGGRPLRCASLPGLRSELAELADRWGLPLDDDGLHALLRHGDGDDVAMVDAPELHTFARLALAANEAVRRDCPLWLVGRAEGF